MGLLKQLLPLVSREILDKLLFVQVENGLVFVVGPLIIQLRDEILTHGPQVDR